MSYMNVYGVFHDHMQSAMCDMQHIMVAGMRVTTIHFMNTNVGMQSVCRQGCLD